MDFDQSMMPWQWLAERSGAAFIVAGLQAISAPLVGMLAAPPRG